MTTSSSPGPAQPLSFLSALADAYANALRQTPRPRAWSAFPTGFGLPASLGKVNADLAFLVPAASRILKATLSGGPLSVPPKFVTRAAYVIARIQDSAKLELRSFMDALEKAVISTSAHGMRLADAGYQDKLLALRKALHRAFARSIRRRWLRQLTQTSQGAVVWLTGTGGAAVGHADWPVDDPSLQPGQTAQPPSTPLEPNFVLPVAPRPPAGPLAGVKATHKAVAGKSPSSARGRRARRPPKPPRLGVTFLDAALILNGEDEELARKTVRRWQKGDTSGLPASIGFATEHRQMKLYPFSALANWIEKREGKTVCRKHDLRARLARKAREPR